MWLRYLPRAHRGLADGVELLDFSSRRSPFRTLAAVSDVPDQIDDQFKLGLVALAGVGGDLAENVGRKTRKPTLTTSSAMASVIDFIASIVADATFRASSDTGVVLPPDTARAAVHRHRVATAVASGSGSGSGSGAGWPLKARAIYNAAACRNRSSICLPVTPMEVR